MRAKKSVSMKAVVLLLAVVLLIGCIAGGTLAYLMAKSATVNNTFVAGEIGALDLAETTGTQYIVTPGVDIEKNPKITFNGNNVAAYVFVKVDATGWTVSADGKTYSIGANQEMKWEMAAGWTKLEDGVYYMEVAADADPENVAETEKYGIIKDDNITVSSKITKGTISDYTKGLTFTAYAIQQETFADAAAAWAVAQTATN